MTSALKERFRPYAWRAYMVLLLTVAAGTLLVEVPAHAGHHHEAGVSTGAVAAECNQTGRTIAVQINSTLINPANISAKQCDKLVFTNTDTDKLVEVGFGPHDKHIEYPGLTDAPIKRGESQTLVLTEIGSYPVHDHINDVAEAELVVTKN